jgi:hypothetical protein
MAIIIITHIYYVAFLLHSLLYVQVRRFRPAITLILVSSHIWLKKERMKVAGTSTGALACMLT